MSVRSTLLTRVSERRAPAEPPAAKTATLGLAIVLTAIAIAVYLLGRPTVGLALIVVTAVLMLFVLTERDAVMVLSVFAVATFAIPSRYIIGPLGALGTPSTIVGLCALIWWAGSRANHGLGADHERQPMRLALLGLLWWLLLTYAWAFARPLTEVEASSAHRTMVSMLALAGVALLAADGIRDRARLETLLRRLVALAAFTAVVGILQYFSFDLAPFLRFPGLIVNSDLEFVTSRSDFARVSGTSAHAIEFGVVLAVLVPFALHFAFYGERRTNAWLLTVLVLMALPVSVSRSGIVGLVVALVVLSVRWTWNQRLVIGAVGFAMVVVTRALSPGLLGTIRSLFLSVEEDNSIEGRTNDYSVVYNYVSDTPWLGRGLGTFEPSQYRFLDNEWLMLAVTTGVIGVLVLLALFVVGWSCARGIGRRTDDEATAHLAQAFLASLMALAVTFGTFDAFSFKVAASTFFLMLGGLGALWRLEVGEVGNGRDHAGRLPRRRATAGDRS